MVRARPGAGLLFCHRFRFHGFLPLPAGLEQGGTTAGVQAWGLFLARVARVGWNYWQLGVTPDDIRPPDIDETPLKGELPRDYCARVTREKVQAVTAAPDDLVLCADTTVALGRRIMGKPRDAGEAAKFLLALSGRRHRVITSVALRRNDKLWQRDVVSQVKMKRLSDEELNGYLATGDWDGKAGGYAIQGIAEGLIRRIQGSHSGVVGLPLYETRILLKSAGFDIA